MKLDAPPESAGDEKTKRPDYRGLAREAAKRARAELSTNEPRRVRYAALETRMAMEGLTYQRALDYQDDFPPEEWRHWQPRKVMTVLLQIDPHADIGGTLAIGTETEFGKPAETLTVIGTEHVLSMTLLKDYYDRIGSGLHLPTRRQIDEGKEHDWSKLRTSCEEILSEIERALSSPLFGAVFSIGCSIGCLRCGALMRRRVPEGDFSVEVRCFECNAGYFFTGKRETKQVHCHPIRDQIRCRNSECDGVEGFWREEVRPGLKWRCQKCGQPFKVGLGVFPDADPTEASGDETGGAT